MSLETLEKKCDFCGLFLKKTEFNKNKAKSDGFHNYCRDCMREQKKNKDRPKAVLVKKEFYYIPDIYLVGYGRHQTYQICCLKCDQGFFCITEVKNESDLFCEECQSTEIQVPERNIAKTNFIGNIVGWLSKIESPTKKRSFRNYKKCYERDKYTCQYCGYNFKNATKFLPLHIDHIKPWSAQGGNSLNNLVVSCQECNLIASDKWFTSFAEKREHIIERRRNKKLD